jgi:hypothetical protein
MEVAASRYLLKSTPPRTSNLLFVNAGSSFGFVGLDTVVAGQVACEDLSTTKAKAPSSKHAQKIRTTTFHTCPIHPSIEYASRQRVKNHLSFKRKTPKPIADG